MEKLIEKWNALNDQQKAAFGDRWITHETNLRSWVKPFEELSELKKKRVLTNIEDIDVNELTNIVGFGIE